MFFFYWIQPVVIHYHRLATKFQTFHSLGPMFALFWFKPNHLWYSCMVSVSRFSRLSALIATSFFLSFFISFFWFLPLVHLLTSCSPCCWTFSFLITHHSVPYGIISRLAALRNLCNNMHQSNNIPESSLRSC